jgi:hypothetical protein
MDCGQAAKPGALLAGDAPVKETDEPTLSRQLARPDAPGSVQVVIGGDPPPVMSKQAHSRASAGSTRCMRWSSDHLAARYGVALAGLSLAPSLTRGGERMIHAFKCVLCGKTVEEYGNNPDPWPTRASVAATATRPRSGPPECGPSSEGSNPT